MSPAPLSAAFRQALSEAWAKGAGLVLPVTFFAGAAVIVPLGIGTEASLLARVGPGILWVALALASLVTLERMFQSDLEDGTLDLWLQTDAPMSALALAKTLAHWLAAGLPLAVLTPLLGIILQVEGERLLPAAVAYGVGGLAFFVWGGVGAALVAGVRRGGLLIALIILPFYVPTLIFGSMTVASGSLTGPPFMLLFALAAAPFGMGAALRLAAD
jgi:heme exporter protein B